MKFYMLVRLIRLYTSTQQEHHSPLFCTVADLQLMLHDSDLPCEQPYFSSPAAEYSFQNKHRKLARNKHSRLRTQQLFWQTITRWPGRPYAWEHDACKRMHGPCKRMGQTHGPKTRSAKSFHVIILRSIFIVKKTVRQTCQGGWLRHVVGRALLENLTSLALQASRRSWLTCARWTGKPCNVPQTAQPRACSGEAVFRSFVGTIQCNQIWTQPRKAQVFIPWWPLFILKV